MRVARWMYQNFLEWTVGALLLVIVVLSGVQVFNRYVLESPLTWTEELARLLLVWAVCLGAAAGIKKGGHLRIDFVYLMTRGVPRKVITLINHAIVFLVALGMAWFGYQFYASTANDYSTSLGYARNMVYLPIPVGGVLIAAFTLARAWQDWIAPPEAGAHAHGEAAIE